MKKLVVAAAAALGLSAGAYADSYLVMGSLGKGFDKKMAKAGAQVVKTFP